MFKKCYFDRITTYLKSKQLVFHLGLTDISQECAQLSQHFRALLVPYVDFRCIIGQQCL